VRSIFLGCVGVFVGGWWYKGEACDTKESDDSETYGSRSAATKKLDKVFGR
jgi:hypothetical protein